MTKTSTTDNTRGAAVKQLISLLQGGNAHATFDKAVEGLPAKHRGTIPDGLPYSIWQLVEHIRIAQWDILEFSKNEDHQSPSWPDDYWPKEAAPASDKDWDDCLKQIKHNQKEFVHLLEDANNDLYKPFPWGDGQNLFREALLIADHTAYHTAEIIVIRRLLGDWE